MGDAGHDFGIGIENGVYGGQVDGKQEEAGEECVVIAGLGGGADLGGNGF